MKERKSKLKNILGIVFLLGICTGFGILQKKASQNITVSKLLTKDSGYFVPLKIDGFSSADIPYLKVNIENRSVIAKIDLGYEGDLCLPSHIINNLNGKKFIKTSTAFGLRGKTYKSEVYQLDKIDIENMTFFPVRAEELNLELEHDINLGEKEIPLQHDLGRIGWCLFHSFNLLVDCENSTLALCDSLETLRKQGYPVDSFTMAPLLLDRGFIEFMATTEAGVLRCILDTGSTWNMLNKDLENSYNHMIFTPENVDQYSSMNPDNENLMDFDPKDVCNVSIFKIGEKEFGPMTFNRIKSPLAFDAIMGMEFFNSTVIFIDFSAGKIYFYEKPLTEEIPPA
ncbi:MAG TPA: hypothetical protein VLG76_04430 [Rhabdochlamydiaceae bacterium]|nr:hypothetical protein [Rhabdochlamydiaceae bacterium]